MIICGFPGVGKSTMAKRSIKWVDLESTPFGKIWSLYAAVAKHMSNNGYTVMVSTHEALLEELEMQGVCYTVVIPPVTDKSTYIRRYEKRGNTEDFIKFLDANWEQWLDDIVRKSSAFRTVVILPENSGIAEWAAEWNKED